MPPLHPRSDWLPAIDSKDGSNVHIVNSEDWTDVDNRMACIELFKLFPEQHIKFIIQGRHINFDYANCLLEGLLVSEEEKQLGEKYKDVISNRFSSLLRDMQDNEVENAVQKILVGRTGSEPEPWVSKLQKPEHQGWFKHRFESYNESEATRQDTALLVQIFQAQAIQAFNEFAIPQDRYSFYQREETLAELNAPIGYHAHKLEIAFSLNLAELEDLLAFEQNLYLQSSNPSISNPHPPDTGYFYSLHRGTHWRKLFTSHLHRLRALSSHSPFNYPPIKSFLDLKTDIGPNLSAWHLGASAVDFYHFTQTHPKNTNVLFAVGQYGSFDSLSTSPEPNSNFSSSSNTSFFPPSSNSNPSTLFPSQFNLALSPSAAFAAFQPQPHSSPSLHSHSSPSNPPHYPLIFFAPTETSKSTSSFPLNPFSFSSSFDEEEPHTWRQFQSIAPLGLITAMKKYANDTEKPEAMFDVVSAAFFVSVLREWLPGVRVAIETGLMPVPPYGPARLVRRGEGVGIEYVGDGKELEEEGEEEGDAGNRLFVFFMPKRKNDDESGDNRGDGGTGGTSWQDQLRDYQTRYAERFWNMQFEIFRDPAKKL